MMKSDDSDDDEDILLRDLEEAIGEVEDEEIVISDHSGHDEHHTTTDENEELIQAQVSRLLVAHGKDAVDCVAELANLLQKRYKQHQDHQREHGESSTSSDTTIDVTATTTGSIGNIVIQAIRERQDVDEDRQAASSSNGNDMTMELQRHGVKVLQYCALMMNNDNHNASFDATQQPFPHPDGMEILLEIMTRYPQQADIQRSCSIGLCELVKYALPRQAPKSKPTSSTPAAATRTTTRPDNNAQNIANHPKHKIELPSKDRSKILFGVLQAMNWHKDNVVILQCGLSILIQFALPTSSTTKQEFRSNQTQIMETIQLTGGLSLLFQALKKKHSLQLKRDAYTALATLVKDNPSHQEMVAMHHAPPENSGMDMILDTMRLCSFHLGLQQDALKLLASLASAHPTTNGNSNNNNSNINNSSKRLLLQKGGLDCILTCMKDYWENVEIQSTGCCGIANLFAYMDPDLRVKGVQCVKPLLRAMRMHPTIPNIQWYACAALKNMTQSHHIGASVSNAGGIATIIVAIQQHANVPPVQEQGWGVLYNMLSQTATTDGSNNADGDGISTLLQTLTKFSKHIRIQQYGLGCLACLSSRQANKQEEIISSKGLDLVLSALYTHGTRNAEIAKHGCDILKNLTVTRDFQRAVICKNGIKLLLDHAMKVHPTNVSIQFHGTKCLRNLCLDPDNIKYVAKEGGILTILQAMRNHVSHSLLNAYACDALSHLALSRQNQVLLLAKNGIDVVVHAMKVHSKHKAVQEQACMFLCQMSRNPSVLEWMKKHPKVLTSLQAANKFLLVEKTLHSNTPTSPMSNRKRWSRGEAQAPQPQLQLPVRDLIKKLQNTNVKLSKDG